MELFTLVHEASGNDKVLQGLSKRRQTYGCKQWCKKRYREEPTKVKIKISYETPDELEEVLRLLHPVTSSYKVAKCQNGAYRRAYVEVAINRQQNGEEVQKY